MNEKLAIGWLLVMGLLVPTYLVLLTCSLRILRDRHPATFRDLGEPSLVFNNSIANSFALQRFILMREYPRLGDPELSRLLGISRVLLIAGYLVQFAFFVLLLT